MFQKSYVGRGGFEPPKANADEVEALGTGQQQFTEPAEGIALAISGAGPPLPGAPAVLGQGLVRHLQDRKERQTEICVDIRLFWR